MSAPQEELRRAVSGVNVAMRRLRGRETHKHQGLSFAQYGLLFALEGGGELSARELGEAAELSPASVAQMLEGLEAQGLVERTRSAQDKRVVLTKLTPTGAQAIAEAHAKLDERWRVLLAEFSDEDLTVATAVLNRLALHLYGLAAHPDEQHDPDAPISRAFG